MTRVAHALTNLFTPRQSRRAADQDNTGVQGRRWFDRDPWCSILKFWPVVVVLVPFLINWIVSVNSIRHEYPRDQTEIKAALVRIESKVDVQAANTVTLATAMSAHTGKPITLITAAGGPR
jgi:hypothetical protein